MYLHKEISTAELDNIVYSNQAIKRLGVRKFMEQSCKYLTLVKPERIKGLYSPESYLTKLREEKYITSEFGTIPTEWITSLVKLFFMVKRSQIVPGVKFSVASNTIYSAATPWVLYAFKSQYGVKYSEWDLEGGPVYSSLQANAGSILLGQGLSKYLKARSIYKEHMIKPVPPPDWVPADWFSRYGSEVPFEGDLDQEWLPNWKPAIEDKVAFRQAYLTHGRTGAIIDEEAYDKGTIQDNRLLVSLPGPLFRHMVTQTWIFTPNLRNTNSMVLSLEDIDEIPEPIVEPTYSPDKPQQEYTDDSPW